MSDLFSLPSELLIAAIGSTLPCRELQIRALATILSTQGAPCRNIVVYGLEATGKTAALQAILKALSTSTTSDGEHESMNGVEHEDILRYTIVKSAECITGRHLLEQTTFQIAKAIGYEGTLGRCENLAQLRVDVGRLLEEWAESSEGRTRMVLVFDGIDMQKDAPQTLVPALARLGEIIPNLTTIFTLTSPPPHFLRLHGVPHIHFPPYTKPELLQILSLHNPQPPLPSGPKETSETWSRFTSIVWDTLSKYSGRDILSFRHLCIRIWPKFIRPILDGQLSAIPFSKLVNANRSLLQNDNLLIADFISAPSTSTIKYTATPTSKPTTTSTTATAVVAPTPPSLTTQLPTTTRLLLLASYLCSHNPPKSDITFFCKSLSISKRKKRGGGTALTSSRPGVSKNRKISRRLLGPQVFVLERMLAVFHFLRGEANLASPSISSLASGNKSRRPRNFGEDIAGSADLLTAISTLASLRLLTKVGNAASGIDILDGGSRYRVNVSWEVVRSIGRSVGVEAEDFIAD